MTINQKKLFIAFYLSKHNEQAYKKLKDVYSDGKRDGLILDFHLTHGKEDK